MDLRPLASQLARRLLLFALDQGLQKALPIIYKRLDAEMPFWMKQGLSPQAAQTLINQVTETALGRTPKPYESALVSLLYNPALGIANAALNKKF